MICSTCGKDKLASRDKDSEFSWRKSYNDYYKRCKKCIAASQRERRHRTPTIEEQAFSAEKEFIEEDPYRWAVGKILERAGLDKDVDFINGEWFEYLCDLAGWEPDHIRRRMAKVYGL